MVLEHQNKISWRAISDGIAYYQEEEFLYKEVPWIIPENVTQITLENGPKTDLGNLLASSEQSLLYLDLNDELIKGRYMTVAPCFKESSQLMCLELYITDNVTLDNLRDVVEICTKFYTKCIRKWPVKKIRTDRGYDLIANDTRLGSYGIREYKQFKWIHATGLMEPVLSHIRTLSLRAK